MLATQPHRFSLLVPNELDQLIKSLQLAVQKLVTFTATDQGTVRSRWVDEISAGRIPKDQPMALNIRLGSVAFQALDRARALAKGTVVESLYHARLDEMEMELAMLDTLHSRDKGRSLRRMAARHFGTGNDQIQIGGRKTTLGSIARAILATTPPSLETILISARGSESVTVESIVNYVAHHAKLEVKVCVDAGLIASAAAGDRTVYLSDRRFGRIEALYLAVHEVLGHLVASANAREQSLGLLSYGTARAAEDQEGLALTIEEHHGFLHGERLRAIAGRVIATDALHHGEPFGATALLLVKEYGFAPIQAVSIAERAYRAGGLARDCIYLRGWLRVREAIDQGETTIDEMRTGRVSISALKEIRELRKLGVVRPPRYTPSLVRNLAATFFGTSFETSPPSRVTSLHKLDAT